MDTAVMEWTDAAQEEYLVRSREMVLLREQKARLEEREVVLKKELMSMLENGEPYGPEGQHRTLEFPRPIRGIARFVRQSKVSQTVDTIAAEAIARKKGIFDRLFVPVPTLDQDAVLVALKEGLITDDEMSEIFPKRVSYAFVAEKEKKR